MTKSQDRDAVRARLKQAEADARQLLTAATEELQQAQLLAVTQNITVPGQLADAVADARRRLSDCEGALHAFERNEIDDHGNKQRAARAAAEQAIDAALTAYQRQVEDLISAIEELMLSGAGARAHQALLALNQSLGTASTSLLTGGGWLVSEAMATMRSDFSKPPADLIRRWANGELSVVGVQTLSAEIRQHVKAHPATWPAV